MNNVSPPRSYYAVQLEELKTEHDKNVKEYNRYGANKEPISIRIHKLKNEIEEVEDKIEQYNKDWDFLAKSEFRIHGTLSKLSQEESYCSNV